MTPLNKYIWLVDTLCRAGERGLTFEEINHKYRYADSVSGGGEYPLRTFHDHRRAIEEVFGIEIACNKSENRYYIRDNEDVRNPSYFRKWLLESISLNNIISENDKLRDRILLENIPSTQPALIPMLNAMRCNEVVSFQYASYQSGTSHLVEAFQPWTLKMFKRRWYVYGFTEGKGNRIYGLDRISQTSPTGTLFQLPDEFDAESIFAVTYGVYVAVEEPIEKIVLRVDEEQAKYLRSLPLHKSQEEIEHHDDYSIFAIYVTPTYDLKQEILSMNNHCEVLAPATLRQEIARLLGQMLEKYN